MNYSETEQEEGLLDNWLHEPVNRKRWDLMVRRGRLESLLEGNCSLRITMDYEEELRGINEQLGYGKSS